MATGTIQKNMVLLWENPNPSASFAAQTINLDLNNYQAVIVVFRVRTDGGWGRVSSFAALGYESFAVAIVWDGAQWGLGRVFTPSSDSVVFGSGINITNNGTENNRMIPEFVYGIK